MTPLNRNHKLEGTGPLLNKKGELRECGWSNSLLYDFSPQMTNRKKLKQWDYYQIVDSEGRYALSFAFAKNGTSGLVECSVFDFVTKEKFYATEKTKSELVLPITTKSGDISFKNKCCEISVEKTNEGRRIYCKFERVFRHTEIIADVFLTEPKTDSLVLATPFKESKKAFCYSQKITSMNAKGFVKVKGRTYTFDENKDFCILNWGRGCFKTKAERVFGVGSGLVNGKPFSYNFGLGFGDTEIVTENAIFYDGKCYKLDFVNIDIPKENIMNAWNITSNDNSLDLTFTPFFNDRIDIKFGIFPQHADNLFGRLNGKILLDDGISVVVEDIVGVLGIRSVEC